MNRVVVVVGLATLVALGMLAYGVWGPYYATEPVRAPFLLSTSETQEFPFEVERSATYFVEVHLKETLPETEMKRILGDFVSGAGGAIDIAWSVTSNRTLVAQGSSTQFGYSPIWGGGYSGLVVGTFEGEKGSPYLLHVTSRHGDSSWDRCEPVVAVGLHPAQLEYLMGYLLIGGALVLILGLVFFSLVGVKVYRWTRNGIAGGRRLTSA